VVRSPLPFAPKRTARNAVQSTMPQKTGSVRRSPASNELALRFIIFPNHSFHDIRHSLPLRRHASGQGLQEVFDKIVGMFKTHGQTKHIARRIGHLALTRCAMLDQTLDATKAGSIDK
jgi:hypothetical protein